MRDVFDLSKFLRGYVRVWNEVGDVTESDNLVVFNGGDIITQLLAGNQEYQISHFYFLYENTVGSPAPIAPARSDTATSLQSITPPQDLLRASILDPVTLEAADVNHLFNRATFLSVTASSTGDVNGLSFGAGSDSKVFHLGMVAAPTGAIGGDILYASFSLPTEIPAAGSGQISAAWATEAD